MNTIPIGQIKTLNHLLADLTYTDLQQEIYPWIKNIRWEKGVPYFKGKRVVPKDQKEDIIKMHFMDFENGGLRGKHALFGKLYPKYLGITFKDVSNFIDKQEISSRYNLKPISIYAKPMIASGPNAIWQIDTIHMGKSASVDTEKQDYIINVIDVYSRKCWLKFTKYKTKESVENFLFEIIQQYGKPKRVHTDRGTEFYITGFLHEFNITHTMGKEYTPQQQGIVERCNQTVKEMLRRYLGMYGGDNKLSEIEDLIPRIQDNINNSFHSYLKMTPNEAYKIRPGQYESREMDKKNRQHLLSYQIKKRVLTGDKLRQTYRVGMKVRISNKREQPYYFNKQTLSNYEKIIQHPGYFSEETYTISNVTDTYIELKERKGERFTSNELRIVR